MGFTTSLHGNCADWPSCLLLVYCEYYFTFLLPWQARALCRYWVYMGIFGIHHQPAWELCRLAQLPTVSSLRKVLWHQCLPAIAIFGGNIDHHGFSLAANKGGEGRQLQKEARAKESWQHLLHELGEELFFMKLGWWASYSLVNLSGASESVKHRGVLWCHQNTAKLRRKTGKSLLVKDQSFQRLEWCILICDPQARKSKERRKSGGQNGVLGLDGIILTDELKKVNLTDSISFDEIIYP